MWIPKTREIRRLEIFFRLMFGGDSLHNYYRVNFQLIYHKICDENNLNNMIPWERDVFINLLMAQLKKEGENSGK